MAKQANHRTTGLGFESGYAGRVYVRQQDYAVVRYESLWQHDTTEVNAIAHKYYGRKNDLARHFPAVYQHHRATHVVTYQKGSSGRYYAATSVARNIMTGHVLGGQPFYLQQTCDVYYASPTVVPATDIPDGKAHPELNGSGTGIWQVAKVPYHPEFWQTYPRPVPAEAAPVVPLPGLEGRRP